MLKSFCIKKRELQRERRRSVSFGIWGKDGRGRGGKERATSLLGGELYDESMRAEKEAKEGSKKEKRKGRKRELNDKVVHRELPELHGLEAVPSFSATFLARFDWSVHACEVNFPLIGRLPRPYFLRRGFPQTRRSTRRIVHCERGRRQNEREAFLGDRNSPSQNLSFS